MTRGRKKCGCHKPTTHPDCSYCGSAWAGEVVCGVCREAGIDGKVIRGTARRVCKGHKAGARRVRAREAYVPFRELFAAE